MTSAGTTTKTGSSQKDALELNRLAGGLTTASGLYFVCLARIPYSFTYTEDPLAFEPVTTLCVASVATWMFSLYTSSRLRSWWRQDLNEAREASQKEVGADGQAAPDPMPMVDVDRSERTLVPLVNALLVPLAAAPILSLAAFALGAPFTYKAHITVVACLYTSVLALTPAAMALPAPWSSHLNMLVWVRIFSAARPKTRTESALMILTWATVLGAIFGAVPTALDWGRVWQTWPVPMVWGAFFGNMLGAMVACLVAGLPDNMAQPKTKPVAASAASSKSSTSTAKTSKKSR